jgi:hypothetical protein
MAGSSDSAMQLEPDSEDSAPGRNKGPSDSGCWASLAASRRDTLRHGYAACELLSSGSGSSSCADFTLQGLRHVAATVRSSYTRSSTAERRKRVEHCP